MRKCYKRNLKYFILFIQIHKYASYGINKTPFFLLKFKIHGILRQSLLKEFKH